LPVYLYRAEDGSEYEAMFPAGQAPPELEFAFGVGEDAPLSMCPTGKVFRRVWTAPHIVCDGHASKWEDNKHRDAAVKEAHRSAKYVRENPDAWPVTIGANDGATTPDFVKSEFDWARKNG